MRKAVVLAMLFVAGAVFGQELNEEVFDLALSALTPSDKNIKIGKLYLIQDEVTAYKYLGDNRFYVGCHGSSQDSISYFILDIPRLKTPNRITALNGYSRINGGALTARYKGYIQVTIDNSIYLLRNFLLVDVNESRL